MPLRLSRPPAVSAITAAVISVAFLVGCSKSATETIANVNDACARVREVTKKIEELQLDDKGADFISDPRVNELLRESADATKDLAKKINETASEDRGRLGGIKQAFDSNKELVGKIGSFVKAESIDEARDRARQLQSLSDIVGADACAG